MRSDLSVGMLSLGGLPFCPTLTRKLSAAKYAKARLLAGLRAGNLRVFRDAKHSLSSATAGKYWELSQAEVAKGWLGTPQVVTNSDSINVIMSPMFCIREQRGKQAPNFRLIGDLTKSSVNLFTELADTCRQQCLGRLLDLRRFLVKKGAGDLESRSLDSPNAYKTIPARPRSYDVANVAFANPGDGGVYRARVLVQPLGSCSAPRNWGRLTTCVQELDVRLFRLRAGAYVDDVFTGEPSTYAQSGFFAFGKFDRSIGLPAACREDQHPAKTIRFLGAVLTVSSGGLTVFADEKRKIDNADRINEAMASGMSTPVGAGRLRVKPGFSPSLAFGEVGRPMLAPLDRRQYAVGTRGIAVELRLCLGRWRRQIPDLKPRFAPYDFRFRLGARSDAQGIGQIAETFRCEGVATVCSLHLPHRLIYQSDPQCDIPPRG